MKTRLYYSFMVGTAIAMGNMRGNPESQNRPAIVTTLNSNSPQTVAASSTSQSLASLPDQNAGSHDGHTAGLTLTA